MTANKRILVAEDEAEVRSYLQMALRCQGYSVELAQDGEEALRLLRTLHGQVGAVLLDVIMPRKDGIEALEEIRAQYADVPVIMMSGASSPNSVVSAMKSGATDFIAKPLSPEDLYAAIEKVCGREQAASRTAEPETAAPAKQVYSGENQRLREIRSTLRQISWSDAPVLIQGETGVGKEVMAREVHAHSRRADKPFLKLNCAALPSELVESELFGYERGAFTGAFQRKPGMFELADGGTLLLDEIGDMDFKLQAKLLQILQDHTMQRLGGKETIKVDVRIIAATHCDLEQAILDRRFREDLYYRLNVISLSLPSLRECPEDIVPLAEFLLRKHTPADAAPPAMTPDLRQALLTHDWPGNVRELENTMRRVTIFRNPDMVARDITGRSRRRAVSPQATLSLVSPAALPLARAAEICPTPILEQVTKAKEQAEADAILTALNATHWNRKQAAAALKIDYKAFLYKMKKLAIDDQKADLAMSSTVA